MSAEKIIEQIQKDTEKEINQIIADAEKQIKTIKQNMIEEANKEAEKILKQGMKKSGNTKKILISKATQNAKRNTMNVQEKIIEECFIKAHHKLSTLNETDYKKLSRKLILDGKNKLDDTCNVKASRDYDKQIAEELGLNVIGSVESAGGIVLISCDGKIALDHTFDGILKRDKENIRIKIGKLLFS